MIPYCDYIFCNETEATLFGDMRVKKHTPTFFNIEINIYIQILYYIFNNIKPKPKIHLYICQKCKGWGRDLSTIALKMSGLPKASGTRPRVVVITQGGQPTMVAHLGKVCSYVVEPLANELLVDINGAGDAFVGGFIAKLVQGESLGDCVRAGHWIARTVIQHSGCTYPKVCDFI